MRIDALRRALASRPGLAVPFDALVDAVWGERLPANPRQALRNLVQRLRATEQVVTEPGGYRLVLRGPGPRQLPADLPDFVGRADEIAAALGSTAPVLAITGPPGVGKTSLAVHVAHRLSERFPDGQLHVNLRAFAEGATVTPQQALHRFLRALGAEDIPVELSAQVELFGRMTAGRAVLVVIDNATPDLIGPLLPAGPNSRVIVTSRADFAGYEQVKVAVFTEDEAQELLTRMRISGSPDDRAELVRLCAHLPLALRIAAANVSAGHLVDYLADLRGDDRLGALEIEGDAAVDAAFEHSYEAQPARARRLFRLLGLIPGQDFGAEAATALLGSPADEPLRQLVAANLVQRNGDRYGLHDLIRMYALRLTTGEPRTRLLDYYLLNAEAAARTINPDFARMPLPPLPDDLPRHEFATKEAAIAWFDAERGNIVAAIPHAGAAPVAWLLADMLRGYFYFHSYRVDWFVAARAGLAAAEQAGDVLAQAVMHGSVGLAHFAASQLADAVVEFGRARALLKQHPDDRMLVSLLINSGLAYRELGRLREGVQVLTEAGERQPDNIAAAFNLGGIYLELGPLSASLANVRRALDLTGSPEMAHARLFALDALVEVFETMGDFDQAARTVEEAAALRAQLPPELSHRTSFYSATALTALSRGRYQEALDAFLKTLEVAQEEGRQREEADLHDSIGDAHRGLGDVSRALASHGEGLAIAVKNGYLRGEVDNLAGLAADHHAAGELTEALKLARLARERAESGELRVRLVRVLVITAGIQRSLGDHAAADATAREARALAEETECRLWDRELREVLAQPPANGGSTSS
ncbi:Tetratricopeptide (TPR) repeat [Lentzea xinjiangensis]|uniref:Tetratricopeptide (TPR) repeat n=1 Tax=Lentzea xinjiangensis TaxID=402600 RepID=A0A1H9EG50_9PSEU|nr:AAA family ATPase [Lentzea xinjiangensis]SEQ24694.1 Tetratricopeptide (TPR) repeat [Lentzea xinjiangensis]